MAHIANILLTSNLHTKSRRVVHSINQALGKTVLQKKLINGNTMRYQTLVNCKNNVVKTFRIPFLNSARLRINKPIQMTLSSTITPTVVSTKPIAWWLIGCAGMVAGMVAVGGITRITRSGLSMVTWKPHGGLPPITQEEWEKEFELYQKFPEFQQRLNMTLNEFKGIYFWEYAHRMLGRTLGLMYALPLGYFLFRNRIPKDMYKRLGVIFALGSVQGGIGWWMVKSGLETPTHNRNEIRVSPYRLATHLGFAFTSYSLLLWTAFDLLSPASKLESIRNMIDPVVMAKSRLIRRVGLNSAAIMGFTIISGAFVAGIDAGMVYNTFPKMNNQWIPDEIFDMKPLYKNIFENTALVQFDHRVLATLTSAGVITMYVMARRPGVWAQLPQATRTALNLTFAALSIQVGLGITTLVNCVPIPLAISHQCGSLGVLTCILWTLHTLRFARASPTVAVKTLKNVVTI